MKRRLATGLFLSTALGASACAAEPYRPARLEDGQIDMQGVWNLSNLTPLERLPGFASLVISREQASAIEERITGMRRNQLTGAAPEAFDEERAVEPIDGEWHSSVLVKPDDGRIPGNAAFLEEAARFRARMATGGVGGDGPEERPPTERCLSSPASTPPMLHVPTLNLHQIVQTPDAVLIQSEWNRDARIVRMNARHNPAALASWLGDSIGWWDSDTLVVETRHFAVASRLRSTAGIYFLVSPATVVTERFTRTADDELSYEFTVADATWYTTTWGGRNHLRRSRELIFEFACHEGNYALQFVLQGFRAQEAGESAAGN
ncbi:MAG TPA: hypothetical protein VGQ22_09875 [Steroidobacteraceae bacterium]|nr:hypothetical protein [Steroidobacteraceae bacterium]